MFLSPVCCTPINDESGQGYIQSKNLIEKAKNLTGQSKFLKTKTRDLIEKAKNLTGQSKFLKTKTRDLIEKTRNLTGQSKFLKTKTRDLAAKAKNLTGQSEDFQKTKLTDMEALDQFAIVINDFTQQNKKIFKKKVYNYIKFQLFQSLLTKAKRATCKNDFSVKVTYMPVFSLFITWVTSWFSIKNTNRIIQILKELRLLRPNLSKNIEQLIKLAKTRKYSAMAGGIFGIIFLVIFICFCICVDKLEMLRKINDKTKGRFLGIIISILTMLCIIFPIITAKKTRAIKLGLVYLSE
jgi:hypothetical protein